jgi:hypothetical protein
MCDARPIYRTGCVDTTTLTTRIAPAPSSGQFRPWSLHQPSPHITMRGPRDSRGSYGQAERTVIMAAWRHMRACMKQSGSTLHPSINSESPSDSLELHGFYLGAICGGCQMRERTHVISAVTPVFTTCFAAFTRFSILSAYFRSRYQEQNTCLLHLLPLHQFARWSTTMPKVHTTWSLAVVLPSRESYVIPGIPL